jgi:hypothetical protein
MTSPLAIDLKFATLEQCFDLLDPSPLSSRDLDPRIARYIVESIESAPGHGVPDIHLRIHLPEVNAPDATQVAAAVRNHWTKAAASERLRLRRVLRSGRRALLVGVLFLMVIFVISEAILTLTETYLIRTIGESLIIFGWVAMWRPAELLLYEWWPVLGRLRVCRKLAEARVDVVGNSMG